MDGQRILFYPNHYGSVSHTDTQAQDGIRNQTQTHKAVEPSDTIGDTNSDMDTNTNVDTYPYTAQHFAQDFPETTEREMFSRIRDTDLPPGRFIKEQLKCTKPERYKTAQQAIGYLVRKYGDFRVMEKFKDYL